jgi:hypothetical protein
VAGDEHTPSTGRPESQSASHGNGSAESKAGTTSGIGLDLSSNSTLMWVAGGGLLAAALVSVGLFGAPGDSQKHAAAPNGASLIRPIGPGETEQAFGKLMMSGPDKEKVRAELADGKLRLGWITVSDNFDEDGDWVRISAAGFRQDVPLKHAPFTFAIPYLPGTPVTVTGLVDGAGGDITVSVYVGTAVLSLRPLKTGETLQVAAP